MANYGLQSIFEESVSAVTATPSIAIGTERYENGRAYVYAFNKATSTAGVKLGVVYSAASGYSVTVSSVIGDGLAGVVVHNQIGPHEYGWICTKGHVAITSSGGSAITQGADIIMDASGAFTRRVTGYTACTGIIVGYATSATDTAGTFAAFINVA